MRPPGSPPRWRCARPDCPQHRWQLTSAVGEYDPMDAALADLERHWAITHRDETERQERAA